MAQLELDRLDDSARGGAVLEHAARRAGPDGRVIVVHALPGGVAATDTGAAARRCRADEIVLGVPASAATGGVADTVLRHSERPVTFVPRGA